MKKATIYILSIFLAIVIISVFLLTLYGERVVWGMILPEDEQLIGVHNIPETLTSELLNEDIIYFRNQILNRTPYAATFIDTAHFLSESDSLIDNSNLVEAKNILKLLTLASVPMTDGIGGGHTKIPLIQRPLNWKFYPFYAYMFEDGLWIIKAGDSYSDIEGAQIVEINQVSIEDVILQTKPFISSDNEMSQLDEFSAYLSYAGFLENMGIIFGDGLLELTIKHPNEDSRKVRIEPLSLFSLAGLQWGQSIQKQVETWSPADPRPRSKNYLFRYLEDENAIYLQFNRVQNQDGESIVQFTERLADFVETNPVDRFIVDIRSNGGGNNQLIEPLIDLISGHPKIDQRGALYTLIGRRTYSAAGAFAMAMELRTKTLFVGERSGFTPNHVGDAVKIPLPNSRILVNISSRYWQDGGPYETRKWLEPDLVIPLKFEHHQNDNDPALQTALTHEVSDWPEDVTESKINNIQNILIGEYEFDPLRRMTIQKNSDSSLVFHISYLNEWAFSNIYPPVSEGKPFTTDIKGVHLEPGAEGQLKMDWKGVQVDLKPIPQSKMNATEQLLAIMEDSAGSVSDVSQLFRDLKNQNVMFDSRIEFQLNKTGYWLLNNNRPGDAVSIFKLQTELFPTVANGFDSLGEGYLALFENQKAKEAFERALQLDPGFTHAKEMLESITK